MEVDDVLAHYGVPGMKWGHKKGTQSSTQLEKAKKSDLEEINHLFNKLSTNDRKFLVLDQKLPLIKKNIRDERHCFVSRLNGKIVGFIRESGRPEGFTLLEELVVSPEHRNKGVASKMLDEFNSSFPKTLAKTKADNKEINTLLKKKGYAADNPNAKSVINWSRQENPTEKNKQVVEKLLNDMSKEEDQNDVKHGGGEMEVNDVLTHYGVPGMHWGVRRGPESYMLTTKRQLARDEKNLKKMDNGKHFSRGITKKRQAAYDARDRAYLEKNIAKNKEKLRPSVLSEDHMKKMTTQKKRLEEMSNKELRELNDRLQLERNYKSLKNDEIAPGKKFVNDVVKESGKEVAKQYTKKYMVSAVEALLL